MARAGTKKQANRDRSANEVKDLTIEKNVCRRIMDIFARIVRHVHM